MSRHRGNLALHNGLREFIIECYSLERFPILRATEFGKLRIPWQFKEIKLHSLFIWKHLKDKSDLKLFLTTLSLFMLHSRALKADENTFHSSTLIYLKAHGPLSPLPNPSKMERNMLSINLHFTFKCLRIIIQIESPLFWFQDRDISPRQISLKLNRLKTFPTSLNGLPSLYLLLPPPVCRNWGWESIFQKLVSCPLYGVSFNMKWEKSCSRIDERNFWRIYIKQERGSFRKEFCKGRMLSENSSHWWSGKNLPYSEHYIKPTLLAHKSNRSLFPRSRSLFKSFKRNKILAHWIFCELNFPHCFKQTFGLFSSLPADLFRTDEKEGASASDTSC